MRYKLAVFVVAIVGLAYAGLVYAEKDKPTPAVLAAMQTPVAPDIHAIFTDVNTERAKANEPALIEDARLDASASAKCADMRARNYFDHDDPNGRSWTYFIQQAEDYQTAGENLAYGFADAQAVVTGWMNSPEHRANILNARFTAVGYAVCHSDNFQDGTPAYIEVQHFTGAS